MSSENLYCADGTDGWTDGWKVDGMWTGDQKCPSIFLSFKYVNKQDVLIPNMVSKVVYGFFIRSYEHFKLGVGVLHFRNYPVYVGFQILGSKVCNLIEHFGTSVDGSARSARR